MVRATKETLDGVSRPGWSTPLSVTELDRAHDRLKEMKRLVVLLALITGLLGHAGPAYGCSCAMLEPGQMLEFAPTAFVGTVAGVVPGGQGDLGPLHTLTFAVETVLAGQVPSEVEVVTADNSAGCGIDAVIGTRMAVFASEDGGRLTSNLCSVTDAEVAIKALGPGVAPTPRSPAEAGESLDWQAVWLGAGGLVLVAGIWLLGRRS